MWALDNTRTVVNVGAGTGSYEPNDRFLLAVEPSAEMIKQRPPATAPCIRATAERLPLPDQSFDAAMAILTIHHWSDPVAGLRKVVRVARRVVVFAYEPTVHRAFWLWQEYFPAAATLSPLRIAHRTGGRHHRHRAGRNNSRAPRLFRWVRTGLLAAASRLP